MDGITNRISTVKRMSAHRLMKLFPVIGLVAIAIIALASPGCSVPANLLNAIYGNDIKAAYPGLEESKVAVVVVSDAASYGPDSLSRVVARAIGNRLSANVKEVTVIDQREIEDWIDKNGWNEKDFIKLGEGVGADKVVSVEIGSYSIKEGSTLYKGRALVTTNVYDLKAEGRVVFSQGPAEYQFPRSHGRPAISTNPQQFEAAYLSMLVESIGRNFYDHSKSSTVAEDAMEF